MPAPGFVPAFAEPLWPVPPVPAVLPPAPAVRPPVPELLPPVPEPPLPFPEPALPAPASVPAEPPPGGSSKRPSPPSPPQPHAIAHAASGMICAAWSLFTIFRRMPRCAALCAWP